MGGLAGWVACTSIAEICWLGNCPTNFCWRATNNTTHGCWLENVWQVGGWRWLWVGGG